MYPELVVRTDSGEVQSVKYEELIPMLLNQVQRQREDSRSQAQLLAQLEAQNAALSARLARLEQSAAPAATLARR